MTFCTLPCLFSLSIYKLKNIFNIISTAKFEVLCSEMENIQMCILCGVRCTYEFIGNGFLSILDVVAVRIQLDAIFEW